MEGSMQGRCDKREQHRKCNTIGPEGAESSSCIINNHALLGHDTEHHDPNTMMADSKKVGEPDPI
jgi:hypothetical protein